jgi:hypothetical protein
VTEQQEMVSVSGYEPEVIEAGTYPTTVVKIMQRHGDFGPYAMWVFQPDGYSEDAQPAGFTSISAGSTSKGMEWARRILGKSTATDMKFGRDIKEKRPVVNWGHEELKGKSCQIVVDKKWDEDEEVYKNTVTNVLPAGVDLQAAQKQAADAASSAEEDFDTIPF